MACSKIRDTLRLASYDRTFVARKARAVFPGQDLEDVMRELDVYGADEHEPERERVHLAILKLCDEKKMDGPAKFVDAAKQDYRDVLAWAEYPNQMNMSPTLQLSEVEKKRIENQDRHQYETWLRKDG